MKCMVAAPYGRHSGFEAYGAVSRMDNATPRRCHSRTCTVRRWICHPLRERKTLYPVFICLEHVKVLSDGVHEEIHEYVNTHTRHSKRSDGDRPAEDVQTKAMCVL